ncbi:MAG: AI-2E family transporter, partial [Akkermansiaceae bacterium]|nr:AI-2E family transporter [Verrucomicrobiales bacterium]
MNIPPPSPKQARILWLALTGLALATLVALIVGLVWGLGQVVQILSPVLWPLAVAGVLAYLLDPLVDWLEKKRLPRPRAILCVFVAALLMIAAVFGSVIPQIVLQTRELAENIPQYSAKVEERVKRWIEKPIVQQFLNSKADHPAPETLSVTTNEANIVVTNSTPPPANGGTNNPAFLGGSLDKETLQSATGWLPTAGKWLFGQF